MVIGNGLLAKNFSKYRDNPSIIFFVSGVSNSSENRVAEFDREKDLLNSIAKKYSVKTLVYFSTCALYDNYFLPNAYLKHKIEVENWIKKNVLKFYIFRVPQIIGSKNESQLLGFINSKIKTGKKFDLFDIERNLIDLNYIVKVVEYIITNNIFKNQCLNISYPENIRVTKIVSIFENIHNKKANFDIKKINGFFKIENKKLMHIYGNLDLILPDYYESKLELYYG
tara:strand:- start:2083 stop:2760 length:678 start_codon:yes stop_codon:yes gene_type:complete